MRLIAFSVEGFRRFALKSSVKLHGPLIALIGPNEAGKSSLLEALAELNHSQPIGEKAYPRRSLLKPSLQWHFQLEVSDKAALKGIHDTRHLDRILITKKVDGGFVWQMLPHSPARDLRQRASLAKTLGRYRSNKLFVAAHSDDENPFKFELYDDVLHRLQDGGDYEDADISKLRKLASTIRGGVSNRGLKGMAEIPENLVALAQREEEPSPWTQVTRALMPRIPRIERFEQEDRELNSTYELEDVAASPPKALKNLASLAQLDLLALNHEAVHGRVADVSTRRNAANKRLSEVFRESWNQHEIAIQFEVQGTTLHIQATTPSDLGLSDIGERSDGMRWFAALLAFTYGWESPPILLVDELETHLHYDAQADLVDVLAGQNFTSKVIYTTHSFGCLPHDLGVGVRAVEPIDAGTSRLENGFWRSGAGFSPLLASMGAAAVSFTPTRYALLTEGAADSILLPTLLRQATGESKLGFQVAPGLSTVAGLDAPDLESEAGRVAFLVDNDPAGAAIRRKLERAGISAHRILMLHGDGTETEDLVNVEVYVEAVNAELKCWNEVEVPLTVSDVSDSIRTKGLESWCQENNLSVPDKRAVAQRLVDESSDQEIVLKSRKSELVALYRDICGILNLD
jgi:ABC-type cobalamin/Fe3+-siderophores transport system ATPase subunit